MHLAESRYQNISQPLCACKHSTVQHEKTHFLLYVVILIRKRRKQAILCFAELVSKMLLN